MDVIHHEKQEGSLCAVHCINALLQGNFFTAVELAELANNMDSEEQQRMAEQGTDTSEYRDFIQGGSNNMDDSGMFSIQVVSAALQVWSLTLTPFTSPTASSACSARDDPTIGRAYICNMKEHWFTIRKIGLQWFNLNSLLAYPELLSDTYLALFLAQLQSQGYSIYLVEGELPANKADEALTIKPVTQRVKPPLLSELSDQARGSDESQEDADLAAALAASLADSDAPSTGPSFSSAMTAAAVASSSGYRLTSSPTEDEQLERALQMSLTEHLTEVPNADVSPRDISTPDIEMVRRARLQALEKNKSKDAS